MKLEDANHLKEVASKIINQQLILPYSSDQSNSLGCEFAFGIHPAGNRNYKLAIHVSNPHYLRLPVIEKIVAQACGEIDLQITGVAQPYSQCNPKKRVRPLSIGVSVSHSNELVGTGSLGCFVRKKQNPSDLFLLSSNHILACKNNAKISDDIISPGREDGGFLGQDNIAVLEEFIPLKFDENNFVDAAIAKIENIEMADPFGLNISRNTLNMTALKGVYLDGVEELIKVFKLGRTTGLTSGKITAFDIERIIPYGPNLICSFKELIAIEGLNNRSFSHKGDSGSLIFDEQGYGVALLLGGTQSGGKNNKGITYANPIHHVFNALDLELAI